MAFIVGLADCAAEIPARTPTIAVGNRSRLKADTVTGETRRAMVIATEIPMATEKTIFFSLVYARPLKLRPTANINLERMKS
jgi:hypothetical protein